MPTPNWAKLNIAPIDYQDAYYYAAPKAKPTLASLDELDPEILLTYQKLGIPIEEQKLLANVEGARKVAVDAVFEERKSVVEGKSVSVSVDHGGCGNIKK